MYFIHICITYTQRSPNGVFSLGFECVEKYAAISDAQPQTRYAGWGACCCWGVCVRKRERERERERMCVCVCAVCVYVCVCAGVSVCAGVRAGACVCVCCVVSAYLSDHVHTFAYACGIRTGHTSRKSVVYENSITSTTQFSNTAKLTGTRQDTKRGSRPVFVHVSDPWAWNYIAHAGWRHWWQKKWYSDRGLDQLRLWHGVATIGRLLKIISLFCRI